MEAGKSQIVNLAPGRTVIEGTVKASAVTPGPIMNGGKGIEIKAIGTAVAGDYTVSYRQAGVANLTYDSQIPEGVTLDAVLVMNSPPLMVGTSPRTSMVRPSPFVWMSRLSRACS